MPEHRADDRHADEQEDRQVLPVEASADAVLHRTRCFRRRQAPRRRSARSSWSTAGRAGRRRSRRPCGTPALMALADDAARRPGREWRLRAPWPLRCRRADRSSRPPPARHHRPLSGRSSRLSATRLRIGGRMSSGWVVGTISTAICEPRSPARTLPAGRRAPAAAIGLERASLVDDPGRQWRHGLQVLRWGRARGDRPASSRQPVQSAHPIRIVPG